jgi:prepilin-type N-terminal cleavage/methylation domain-containing protein
MGKKMKPMSKTHNVGLTLIEVMVVILIVAIAVVGGMQFRYYCVTDAKRADVEINAARLGAMLLETWKGMGSLSTYNPSMTFPLSTYSSQFEIAPATAVIASPTGYSALPTTYQVRDKANNVYYYVALACKAATSSDPKALNAVVSWRRDYTAGGVAADSQLMNLTTYID